MQTPFRIDFWHRLGCVGACLALAGGNHLAACTLWAIAGDEAGGGTIISKNRDWKPDHTQVLKLHRAPGSYAYFGLYAEGNDKPGLKGGVNEKGLTVVTATASSIPEASRAKQPGKRGALAVLLANYATCDEIVARLETIFPRTSAGFFLIADRCKVLVVEVGLDGKFAHRLVERGAVAHTNHFLEPSLGAFNLKVGRSSTTRLNRIGELLAQEPRPLATAAFVRMSRDQHAGPDNSLWRTGKSSRTLSSWIVESPAEGAQRLRVYLANPGQPEELRTYVLNEEFWRSGN